MSARIQRGGIPFPAHGSSRKRVGKEGNRMTPHIENSALTVGQAMFQLNPPPAPRAPMTVKKRSGAHEPIDLNKIVRAVTRCAEGIADIDPMRVALKTIAGLYDGASTRELDELSI